MSRVGPSGISIAVDNEVKIDIGSRDTLLSYQFISDEYILLILKVVIILTFLYVLSDGTDVYQWHDFPTASDQGWVTNTTRYRWCPYLSASPRNVCLGDLETQHFAQSRLCIEMHSHVSCHGLSARLHGLQQWQSMVVVARAKGHVTTRMSHASLLLNWSFPPEWDHMQDNTLLSSILFKGL